MILEIRC